MKETSTLATGKLARTAITGVAAAKVGLKHVAHKSRRALNRESEGVEAQHAHEVELGKLLFSALSQLRGTALKVSQMLSMEAGLLPEGVRTELAKGCYQVPPLNRAHLHKVFAREFGQQAEEVFASFEPNAFAAASLGQVHKAITHEGVPVAVKIQYPGIAASIDSDMKILRGLLRTLSATTRMLPRMPVIDLVLDEIEARLREEVDYELEAENTQWFQTAIKSFDLQIPEVLEAQSSSKILTTTRLDGQHLDEWLAGNPGQEERDHFGQLMFDHFIHSVFELGRLHADPHPGNYLFMPGWCMGLLDFGCVKTIAPSFPLSMAEVLNSLLENDKQPNSTRILRAYQIHGLLAKELTVEEYETQLMPTLQPMTDWLVAPFRKDGFDFSKRESYPDIHKLDSKVTAKYLKGMQNDQVYFDRSFFGVMHMLEKIGATVQTKNRWIHS